MDGAGAGAGGWGVGDVFGGVPDQDVQCVVVGGVGPVDQQGGGGTRSGFDLHEVVAALAWSLTKEARDAADRR